MNRSSSWLTVLPSLLIPICLGLMMYLGLSAMLERGVIDDETVVRYLTGHPVSKVTLLLFFIGVGSLGMIATNVFGQFASARAIRLKTPTEEESTDNKSAFDLAVDLGQQLVDLPKKFREHYLWQRLHEALHFVHRTGSAAGLEDETKYLAELDIDRQQQRYSLVRILIWATPMLGFLGTVLGISQALGGIDIGPDNDFQQMMAGLRSSLYVAFDTTALALTLSIVLMFGQFLIDRFESQLLRLVDYQTRNELSAHFTMSADHETSTIETIAASVFAAADDVVERQTELWRKTIGAAELAWTDSISGVSEQVQESLTSAIDSAVSNLGSSLDESIRRADLSMTHRWQQWQVMLSENTRNIKEQQRDVFLQTQIIKEVVEQMEKVEPLDIMTHLFDRNIEVYDSKPDPFPLAEDKAAADNHTGLEVQFHTKQPLEKDEQTAKPIYSESAKQASSDVDVKVVVPEVVILSTASKPKLKVFGFDDLESHEDSRKEGMQPLPRYRAAEKRAGAKAIVAFPIQKVDPSKKAA